MEAARGAARSADIDDEREGGEARGARTNARGARDDDDEGRRAAKCAAAGDAKRETRLPRSRARSVR
jgi:hypothetical protein